MSVLAGQKPQPDLQTPRLWLDCRPRGFAKHPQGESVNPLMWCAGSNQVSRNGWHDTRSCWTTGCNCWNLWLKKKKKKRIRVPEKQGMIHQHTIAMTQKASRVCINQGGFVFETMAESTHLQPRWLKMGAAPVSFIHPPPQLQVFNQIIHKLYK